MSQAVAWQNKRKTEKQELEYPNSQCLRPESLLITSATF